MNRRLNAIAIAALLGAPAFAAEADPRTAYYQEAAHASELLMIEAGEIDPAREAFTFPAGYDAPPEPGKSGRQYFLVQFDHAPTVRELDGFRAKGWEFLDSIPHNGYAVRSGDSGAALLAATPGVRWSSELLPGFKVSRAVLAESSRASAAGGTVDVLFSVWPGESRDALAAKLRTLGAAIIEAPAFTRHARLTVRIEPDLLPVAAGFGEVEWIEPAPRVTLRNNSCTGILQSGIDGTVAGSHPLWDHGLHGEGQVIGHIDGALDSSSCYFNDPDHPIGPAHRKIVGYRGSAGTDTHGTHTAGTSCGANISGAAANEGHAFAAKISHSNNLAGFGDTPTNLETLLLAAQSDGASVHTNSYGDDFVSSYTYFCVDIDTFSWENEDGLVMFASTNSSNILYTPENAKDVLAVGNAQHSPNHLTPISNGALGPTDDGRRKPEIYSPGSSTLSATPGACSTGSLTGTSMASPAITGEAALARQYFVDGFYPTGQASAADAMTPSGALLKAVLLNSTVNMTPAGYPGDREGWGLLKLDDALYFTGDSRRLLAFDRRRSEANGLAQGETREFHIAVGGAGEPLRITLVWMDPPVARNATMIPVNNLDLELVAPDNTVYLGNAISDGESQPGGTADAINNVEMAMLAVPAAGEYTIRIKAPTVDALHGEQGYAVVATGGVSPGSTATIEFLAPEYACSGTATVRLLDGNAPGGMASVLFEGSFGDFATVEATQSSPGIYVAEVPLISIAAPADPSRIRVADGDVLTVRYIDAEAGSISETTSIDCVGPVVSPLLFDSITEAGADVTFTTDEASTGTVSFGHDCEWGIEAVVEFKHGSGSTYTASVTGLSPGQDYFATVSAYDSLGNLSPPQACARFRTKYVTTSAAFDFEPGEQGFTIQTVSGGSAGAWRREMDVLASSPTHDFHAPDISGIQDALLVSPPVALPVANPYLRFMHTYAFESPDWDGGVVEISPDAGVSWFDLGPNIEAGGYTGVVATGSSNPIGGDAAWVGGITGPMAMVQANVSNWAGQTAQFRWRACADVSAGADGWRIDDVEVVSLAGTSLSEPGIDAAPIVFDLEGAGSPVAPPAGGNPSDPHWVLTSSPHSHSGAQVYRVDDVLGLTDAQLLSPYISIGAEPVWISFWQTYYLSTAWGVVEISSDGGTNWIDAAPYFIAGGYNFPDGWYGGTAGPMGETVLDMSSFANQTVRLRWRAQSHNLPFPPGGRAWEVDDVTVRTFTTCP